MTGEELIKRAKNVIQIEADSVKALIERIDENFVRAVDILYHCKGRVIVVGMGKSGIIARKIASTMASTGTPALFLHPAEGVHGDLGTVVVFDTVVIISNSGETKEIIEILPSIKRIGVKVIALTGKIDSTLGKTSDVAVDVSVKEEACPLGLAPTASTSAQLAMGDALAVALLVKRDFKPEDYAMLHPAGSLGRGLLKVEDIMRKGKDIPVVAENLPVKKVILEITSKKMGCTTVVNTSAVACASTT
jgi:arabinose-5-phosphate isomerase